MFGDDQEIEYDRLYSTLDRAKIIAFAQHRASMISFQAGRSVHLMAVGELAAKYVAILYPDTDRLERLYRTRVCESAGFLHETLLQACSFEDVVLLADEAVAKMVAALTPDMREPSPKRVKLLANQIGLADRDAQVVMLADLRHECDRHSRLAATEPAAVAAWVDHAFSLLSHLRKLNETPLHSRVRSLRDKLGELDATVRKPRRQSERVAT